MWTPGRPHPQDPGVGRRAAGSAGVRACVQTRVHVASPGRDGDSLLGGASRQGGGVICPHFPDERTETWSSLGTNHTNKAEVKGHTAARPGEPFPVPLHLGTGDRVGVGSDPAAGIAGGRVLLTHSSVTCRTDAACSLSRACEQQPGPSSPLGLRASQRSV